jgi:hypothetical protein
MSSVITNPSNTCSICKEQQHQQMHWLKKLELGYTCRDVKKGVYHDEHKCPDVNIVAAQKEFLDQIEQYEQYVVLHSVLTLVIYSANAQSYVEV